MNQAKLLMPIKIVLLFFTVSFVLLSNMNAMASQNDMQRTLVYNARNPVNRPVFAQPKTAQQAIQSPATVSVPSIQPADASVGAPVEITPVIAPVSIAPVQTNQPVNAPIEIEEPETPNQQIQPFTIPAASSTQITVPTPQMAPTIAPVIVPQENPAQQVTIPATSATQFTIPATQTTPTATPVVVSPVVNATQQITVPVTVPDASTTQVTVPTAIPVTAPTSIPTVIPPTQQVAVSTPTTTTQVQGMASGEIISLNDRIAQLYAQMQNAQGKTFDARTNATFGASLVDVFNESVETQSFTIQLLRAAATTPLLNADQRNYVLQTMIPNLDQIDDTTKSITPTATALAPEIAAIPPGHFKAVKTKKAATKKSKKDKTSATQQNNAAPTTPAPSGKKKSKKGKNAHTPPAEAVAGVVIATPVAPAATSTSAVAASATTKSTGKKKKKSRAAAASPTCN